MARIVSLSDALGYEEGDRSPFIPVSILRETGTAFYILDAQRRTVTKEDIRGQRRQVEEVWFRIKLQGGSQEHEVNGRGDIQHYEDGRATLTLGVTETRAQLADLFRTARQQHEELAIGPVRVMQRPSDRPGMDGAYVFIDLKRDLPAWAIDAPEDQPALPAGQAEDDLADLPF